MEALYLILKANLYHQGHQSREQVGISLPGQLNPTAESYFILLILGYTFVLIISTISATALPVVQVQVRFCPRDSLAEQADEFPPSICVQVVQRCQLCPGAVKQCQQAVELVEMLKLIQ